MHTTVAAVTCALKRECLHRLWIVMLLFPQVNATDIGDKVIQRAGLLRVEV